MADLVIECRDGHLCHARLLGINRASVDARAG